jgi:hypothetical protein
MASRQSARPGSSATSAWPGWRVPIPAFDDGLRLGARSCIGYLPLGIDGYVQAPRPRAHSPDLPTLLISYRRFFIFLISTYLISIGSLRLIFVRSNGLSGHVAWIVMERSRLLFARLLLVRILVVGHEMLLEFCFAAVALLESGDRSRSCWFDRSQGRSH